MAQLKFYYGTMGSGKTTELLKKYELHKKDGRNPIIIKPIIDDREGSQQGWGKIKSRLIDNGDDAYYFKDISKEVFPLEFDSLFVDEAQFLTERDVKMLEMVVMYTNRDVICYGLERDVNNNIFEGAYHLMKESDTKEELKNKCQYGNCGCYATNHVRYVDGKLDIGTEPIVIEKGKVTYKSVCYRHWQQLRQNTRG